MGQQDKAAEAWNKVVKMDPASRSDLYKKLYGIPEPNCRIPVRD